MHSCYNGRWSQQSMRQLWPLGMTQAERYLTKGSHDGSQIQAVPPHEQCAAHLAAHAGGNRGGRAAALLAGNALLADDTLLVGVILLACSSSTLRSFTTSSTSVVHKRSRLWRLAVQPNSNPPPALGQRRSNGRRRRGDAATCGQGLVTVSTAKIECSGHDCVHPCAQLLVVVVVVVQRARARAGGARSDGRAL